MKMTQGKKHPIETLEAYAKFLFAKKLKNDDTLKEMGIPDFREESFTKKYKVNKNQPLLWRNGHQDFKEVYERVTLNNFFNEMPKVFANLCRKDPAKALAAISSDELAHKMRNREEVENKGEVKHTINIVKFTEEKKK